MNPTEPKNQFKKNLDNCYVYIITNSVLRLIMMMMMIYNS